MTLFTQHLKFSCETCTRGHRARDCQHFGQIFEGCVYLINDRGRPSKDKPQQKTQIRLVNARVSPENMKCQNSSKYCFQCTPKCCGTNSKLCIFLEESSLIMETQDGKIITIADTDELPKSAQDTTREYTAFYASGNGVKKGENYEPTTRPYHKKKTDRVEKPKPSGSSNIRKDQRTFTQAVNTLLQSEIQPQSQPIQRVLINGHNNLDNNTLDLNHPFDLNDQGTFDQGIFDQDFYELNTLDVYGQQNSDQNSDIFILDNRIINTTDTTTAVPRYNDAEALDDQDLKTYHTLFEHLYGVRSNDTLIDVDAKSEPTTPI